jgi:hypothetical protein
MDFHNRTKKLLTLFFIISVVGLVLYGVALYFNYHESLKNSNLIRDVEAQADKNDKADTIRRIVLETVDSRSKIDSFFLPKNGVVDFLDKIENMAKAKKLTYKIHSINEEDFDGKTLVGPDYLSIIRITLQVNGSWNNIYNYLLLMESVPYRVDVVGIRITKAENLKNDAGKWSGFIDLNILKLK